MLDPLGMKDTSFYVTDPAKQALIAEPFPNDRKIGNDADMNDPAWRRSGNPAAAAWCPPSPTMPASRRCCSTAARSTASAISARRPSPIWARTISGPARGVVPGPYYLPGPGFGFGLGFAVRTEAGVSPAEGSVGEMNWSGAGGTTFWIDPKENMFVVFMAQTVSQRGRIAGGA